MKEALKVAAAIALCEAAGVVGSFYTAQSIPTWYATLARPELAPPNWVFGPVWTTLFALMGIALYLVWKKGANTRTGKTALTIFAVQLVLNVLWSVIFFGARSPGGALLEIALLWFAIAATIIAFKRISLAAAWLLAPYFLWVSFAMYLNYAIWVLN